MRNCTHCTRYGFQQLIFIDFQTLHTHTHILINHTRKKNSKVFFSLYVTTWFSLLIKKKFYYLNILIYKQQTQKPKKRKFSINKQKKKIFFYNLKKVFITGNNIPLPIIDFNGLKHTLKHTHFSLKFSFFFLNNIWPHNYVFFSPS